MSYYEEENKKQYRPFEISNTVWVVLGIVVAFFLLVGGILAYTQNTAIGYEETIKNDTSALQVQAQRKFDLITNYGIYRP